MLFQKFFSKQNTGTAKLLLKSCTLLCGENKTFPKPPVLFIAHLLATYKVKPLPFFLETKPVKPLQRYI